MKNILAILIVLVSGIFATSCIEQEYPTFTESLVEFDATVMNNPALGKTFPLLARVPRPGFALAAADPFITRSTGTVPLRVNFVSPQSPADQTITFRVVEDETTAVAGVHYNVGTQTVIPANTSFAQVDITILNAGPSTDGPRLLVLELIGNETIQPSERYKRVGISINQQ